MTRYFTRRHEVTLHIPAYLLDRYKLTAEEAMMDVEHLMVATLDLAMGDGIADGFAQLRRAHPQRCKP